MAKRMTCLTELMRKGVSKMKKTIVCILTVAIMAFCTTVALAGQSTTVNMNASVPTISGGLNLTVSKVVNDAWTTVTSMDFGALALDNTYNIFRPADGRYYAVDVGVRDNSGNVWTITHTRSSFKKDATNNLDDNVNVTFVRQIDANTGEELGAASFANSNNISYTKTNIGSGHWLRIYYGIAAGQDDAPNVEPIGLDKPAGNYAGSVTITLAP